MTPSYWSTGHAGSGGTCGPEPAADHDYDRLDGPSMETVLFQRIVVGTDGSPTAARAVERAIRVARLTGAVVHLVSAHRPIAVHLGSAYQPGPAPAAMGGR